MPRARRDDGDRRGLSPASYDYFSEFTSRRVPVVCVNERLTRVGSVDFVGTAEGHGGRLAAEYLLGKGHRRLSCLIGGPGSANLEMRYQGFKRAVDAAGVGCTALRMPGSGLDEGVAALVELLRRPKRPTAFFCVSDLYAAMLYKAAEQLGLGVPEDVSVLGFSGLPWGRYLSPGLSTLNQDGHRIGREATAALLRRLDGSTAPAVSKRVRVELVERASVRAV